MASSAAQREFDLYRSDEAAARAILDRADEEKRSTTAEEDEQFDKLLESSKMHKDRSDKLVEADKAAAEASEMVRAIIGEPTDEESGEPPSTTRGASDKDLMASIFAAQAHIRGEGTSEGFTERVFKMRPDIEVVRSTRQKDLEEIRAIANFSDSGKLWVADFATRVAVYQRTLSPWFNIAFVQTADNGRDLRLPQLTADPTAYTPGEGTAITAADATLGTATVTLTSWKALNYISAEAEEDEVIGYLPLVARAQGRQIGLSHGTAFSTTVLAGINNGGTAGGTGGYGTAAGAFFGYDDLIALKYGRAAGYRDVGVFVMSNGAIQKAKKWKDGNGQYLLQPAIGAGAPNTLDGSPVYEDPGLATPASATKSVIFGDPQALYIKQVPLRVAVSTEFKFDTDQVSLKSVLRAGIAVVDPAGMAYLVSANT